MPSLSRSTARVVARSRLLVLPSTSAASPSHACRPIFALGADVLSCSTPSTSKPVANGDGGTHPWVLATERRYRRRPWGGECHIAVKSRLGFALVGSNHCATKTSRTLSTIPARPVGASIKGAGDEKHHSDENEDYGSKGEEEEEEKEEEPSDSIYKILTGRPQADPSDYVEERRQYAFPETMEGWKILFRDVWTTYYNTFQGWETEEERIERERQERLAKGVPIDDENEDDETETVYEIEYDEDALRRTQKEITDNFGRNLNIAHSTGHDLLEHAKAKTGIKTKEDLKMWAGEQMKLATACLSEFMGGYREGRDEEVDRMLHEYFKDLDKTDEEGSAGGAGDADARESPSDTSAKMEEKNAEDDGDADASTCRSEKRAGRRRRKRQH